MKSLNQSLVLAIVAASLQPVFAADITGKITLKGSPPKEIDLPLDPACRANVPSGKATTTTFYTVDKNGGLADTVVYLKTGVTAKASPPAEPVTIDQLGCQYSPGIFVLQVGQKLIVKNSDPGVLHNVHILPDAQAPNNKEANTASMAGMPPLSYTFSDPEIFLHIKCDVHNWMNTYGAVLTHPYWAISKADGTFTIKDVPAGKYTVEAVHRKASAPAYKGITKDVTVAADGAKVDFTIEVPAQ